MLFRIPVKDYQLKKYTTEFGKKDIKTKRYREGERAGQKARNGSPKTGGARIKAEGVEGKKARGSTGAV
jgi:hypothetical protein